MAYATTNPPRMMVAGSIDNSVPGNIWVYSSTDTGATVDGLNYFTNGYSLGMRIGDQVIVINTTSKITTWHYVAAGAADGVMDLGDGTTIGSSTNTD